MTVVARTSDERDSLRKEAEKFEASREETGARDARGRENLKSSFREASSQRNFSGGALSCPERASRNDDTLIVLRVIVSRRENDRRAINHPCAKSCGGGFASSTGAAADSLAFLARGQAVVNGGTCGNCLSCELAEGGGQAVNERVDIGMCY